MQPDLWLVKYDPEGNYGSVIDRSGPTHLLRIYFAQYVCVCLSVPTCLCRFCGNFIILSWNTCSCLTPLFSFFFFSFPSLTALICSVDHITLSPYPSPCAKLLFLQPFFFFLCPLFFQWDSFYPSLFLSLMYTYSHRHTCVFSRTHMRSSPGLSGCCHFPFLSAQ